MPKYEVGQWVRWQHLDGIVYTSKILAISDTHYFVKDWVGCCNIPISWVLG